MGKIERIRQSNMHAQKGQCYYCSLLMWERAPHDEHLIICQTPAIRRMLRCTAEHLVPRSDGGKDAADNIVAACWFCNTRRHHRKQPLSPDAYRADVQKRMSTGRWLAALVPLSAGVPFELFKPAMSKAKSRQPDHLYYAAASPSCR